MFKCYENEICKIYKLRVSFICIINYSYLIVDKSTSIGIIIDPAWNYRLINNLINDEKIKLKYIFLTHSHYDHVNLVNPLVKKYDPQVLISSKEHEFYNFKCKNLTLVNNNDVLKIGNLIFKFILTPGHTKGSMCILADEFLFTGDTVFIEGVGICTQSGASAEDMFNSVQYIKNNIDENVRVFPGHCYGKDLGEKLIELSKYNIYFKIDDMEKFIRFRMRKNQKKLFKFS